MLGSTRAGGRTARATVGRRLSGACLGLVLALAAAGCGVGGGDGGGEDTGGDGRTTLTIGGIFPLTGPQSFLGEYYENGAELRIQELAEAGSDLTVELVAYDDESSPEGSARAAQRLLTRDGAQLLMGTGSVPNTTAVATAANDAEVPFLGISGYTVDAAADPFVFNVAPRSEFAAEVAFQHFMEQGWTNVALLMPIGALGEEGTRIAEVAAEKLGLTIVGSESFDTAAADVTTQLARLRDRNPDAVFSFATGEPAAMVARDMGAIGLDVPLLVSHGNANAGFLELVADQPGQIFVPSGVATAPDTVTDDEERAEVVRAFAEHYREEYGEDPNFFSGMAYDAVSLAAAAAEQSGSTDPAALREALESLQLDAVTASFELTAEDHHGSDASDLALLTVDNGAWARAD